MLTKKIMIERARKLRRNTTDAEDHLWQFLRNNFLHGYKFRRQHVINHYILDFVCINKKLVIELDGGQHLENEEYDKKRSLFLSNKGYKILRFWNNAVFLETEEILESILQALES